MKDQSFLIILCTFVALMSCNPDCPSDTIFNQFENACIPKSLIFSEDINIEEICTGVFFSPRPYPGDNTLFVGCIRGLPRIFTCYEDEIFDENILECILQVWETTTGFIRSTETTTHFTTTSSFTEIPTTLNQTESTTQFTTTTSFTEIPSTLTQTESTTLSVTTSSSTEFPSTLTNTESTSTSSFTEIPTTLNQTESTTQFTTTSSFSENPSTLTQTESSTQSTSTEIPTEPTTTNKPNPCAGIFFGRIPHPDDCTLCRLCLSQQLMDNECKCQAGQIFWINDCVSGDPQTCLPLN